MRFTVIVTAFTLVLIGCGGGDGVSSGTADTSGTEVVISVGQTSVTADQLQPVLEELHGDSAQIENRAVSIVNRLLVLEDARSRGLDHSEEFSDYVNSIRRNKLQTMWQEWLLRRRLTVPQDSIRALYDRMDRMVTYTVVTVEDSLLADSLRNLVLNGADMRELSVRYNINRSVSLRGGFIGPLRLIDSRPYDKVLLNGLGQGEVSEIEYTDPGYRFLKLDSSFTDTLPPLEEVSSQIENRLLAGMRSDYLGFLYDSLMHSSNVSIDTSAVELLASHFAIDSSGFEPFSNDDAAVQIYSYDGGSSSVLETALRLRNVPRIPEYPVWDPQWLCGYMTNLAVNDVMAAKAVGMGMDTLQTVRDYVRSLAEDHLLDLYHSSVIEPRCIVDEDELERAFQNMEDTLTIPEQRVFLAIAAVDDEEKDLLRNTLDSGGDPFQTYRSFEPAEGMLAQGESLLTIPLKYSMIPQPYNDILFGAEMNETVTCTLSTGKVLVFKPVEIMPERPATLEDVRNDLLSELKNQKEEEVVTGLVDSLSSVYHIEIDRDFIDGFISSRSDSI